MTLRTEKIASLLHKEVGEYIAHQEFDSMTTVSKVEVTPDMKWCKIGITVLDTPEKQKEILGRLKGARRQLQQSFIKKFSVKIVPKISFVLDLGEEYASHINELLRQTHEDQ